MKIAYALEKDDVVQFYRHYLRTAPEVRRVVIRNFLLGLPFACGPGLLYLANRHWAWGAGFFLGGFAVYCLLMWGGTLLNRAWYFRGLRKGRALDGLVGPGSVTLSSDGVTTVSVRSDARYPWSGIERIERTESQLLIWNSGASAVIVPLRAFPAPSDAQAFEALARQLKAAAA